MTVGIIIQARMGSSRLPGKILMPIAGKPLLDHVLGRLTQLVYPAVVVLATTEGEKDDVVAEHCRSLGIPIFRGSEEDVLDRYWRCAQTHRFDHVVRLTADNPFTDIEELGRLIGEHLEHGNDYTHSFGIMPLGVGAEIFTFEALDRSFRDGLAPNHREHVNEYIQENPTLFRIGALLVAPEKRAPDLRLTVDTENDYRRACAIATHGQGRWIKTEEAIRICLHSV